MVGAFGRGLCHLDDIMSQWRALFGRLHIPCFFLPFSAIPHHDRERLDDHVSCVSCVSCANVLGCGMAIIVERKQLGLTTFWATAFCHQMMARSMAITSCTFPSIAFLPLLPELPGGLQ